LVQSVLDIPVTQRNWQVDSVTHFWH